MLYVYLKYIGQTFACKHKKRIISAAQKKVMFNISIC